MRQVAQIMGLPISIDIPDCQEPGVFEAAFKRLRAIDEKFSTYKPQSEVSRFAAGEIPKAKLSGELKQIIKACQKAEAETKGYFSAWAGGDFDPSGYVKGWAIAEAGRVIEEQGFSTYCLGAGGDILARSTGQKIWNVGIQDPKDRSKILNTLSITNGAVATSGNYQRGLHIINPKTGQPASYWASVTVVGPDIIKTDVLATACFAMGSLAPEFMATQKIYELIAVKA